MNDKALTWDSAHQVVELALNRRQIREDIRVIELKVIQDRCAWAVMDELGALVEKGAVVFIGLNHKKRRLPKARRYREVLRHTANQETRAHACMLQHPGQHAAGGGLAVSARHCQDPTALQHMVRQPLGAGDVRQAFVQYVFHRRVAARHGVADDDQVRHRVELRRVVTLDQLNPLRL